MHASIHPHSQNVFITGATGFVGKCVLEKLLRSVPEVGTVVRECVCV
jgi:thioester reductase-like protein